MASFVERIPEVVADAGEAAGVKIGSCNVMHVKMRADVKMGLCSGRSSRSFWSTRSGALVIRLRSLFWTALCSDVSLFRYAASTRQCKDEMLAFGRGSGGRLCGSYMACSMNLGDVCLARD